MNRKKSTYLFAISWLIISTVLLTLPGATFPKPNWQDKIWLDKWVHIIIFFLLTFSWGLAIKSGKKNYTGLKKIYFWIALLSSLYGFIMELVQLYFIPNRSFDSGDIIADIIGAFIAFYVLVRGIKK